LGRRQFIAVGLPPYLYAEVIEKAARIEQRPSYLLEQIVRVALEKGFVPEEG